MQYEKEELLGAVKDFIAVMKDSGLGHMCVKNDKFEIELGEKQAPMMPPMPQMMAPMAAPMTMPQTPVQQSVPVQSAPEVKISGNIVKSPIVGTFYAAPAPGKAPYATVGQSVNKGDVLFIIESMKLMNEVTSEFSGKITEILVKDGEAVEFDQPILVIE